MCMAAVARRYNICEEQLSSGILPVLTYLYI